MPHIQEHAAQLNLILGHQIASNPRWIAKTKTISAANNHCWRRISKDTTIYNHTAVDRESINRRGVFQMR